MQNVNTISATVARSKQEGIPISEYALRKLIKEGKIPASKIGAKALVYWPNVEAFLKGQAVIR